MISKLKAINDKGFEIGLKQGDKVLYLGASHGVTAKMMAEIVKDEGFIFCLDISSRVMRDLLYVCQNHDNMAPLLYDANKPEEYEDKVVWVDFIYQDLAQKNQVDIFRNNAERFLKEGGKFVLIIKARSIDAVKPTEKVLEEVKKKLQGYTITNEVNLEKTHKGHYALLGEKNG